jgi:hypothetical protein
VIGHVIGVSILPLSTIFSIGFWNCSDSVIVFIFHFNPSTSTTESDVTFFNIPLPGKGMLKKVTSDSVVDVLGLK